MALEKRMTENKLPRQAIEWTRPERKRRGRLRKSWREGTKKCYELAKPNRRTMPNRGNRGKRTAMTDNTNRYVHVQINTCK